MFSDKKLNYFQSRDHQILWSLIIFQWGLLSHNGTNLWFLMRRIQWDQLPQLQCFWKFFHARNGSWIETVGNQKAQDQGCVLSVVAVRFLPIPEFLSWLFVQYGVSHSPAARELYFSSLKISSRNFMNSLQLLRIKSSIDCTPVHRLHSQWITPSKFHQTHKITLGPYQFF